MPERTKRSSEDQPDTGSSFENADRVQLSAVAISGGLANRVTIMTQASAQLVASIGRLSDSRGVVLVPYIDMQFLGVAVEDDDADDADDVSKVEYSPLIALENFAFMLASLSRGGAHACEQVEEMSKGQLKPDVERLKQTKDFLETVKTAIDISITSLDNTIHDAIEAASQPGDAVLAKRRKPARSKGNT